MKHLLLQHLNQIAQWIKILEITGIRLMRPTTINVSWIESPKDHRILIRNVNTGDAEQQDEDCQDSRKTRYISFLETRTGFYFRARSDGLTEIARRLSRGHIWRNGEPSSQSEHTRLYFPVRQCFRRDKIARKWRDTIPSRAILPSRYIKKMIATDFMRRAKRPCSKKRLRDCLNFSKSPVPSHDLKIIQDL